MVLEVTDLEVRYSTPDGPVYALNGVSFRIEDGVSYGLTGESGCGKSTVAEAILGLLPDNGHIEAGAIEFNGRDLRTLSAESRRDVRWEEIAYIPQSAMDALDPVMSVGDQIVQAIRTNRNISKTGARTQAADLFDAVGLDTARLDEYPHQFSGGMRQRVVIAMALALEPELVIADEPGKGLDVIVQDKIMDQVLQIQDRIDSSLLLITHDVGTVAESCDEFSLLYGGKIMEQGSVDNVLLHPTNPYTMGLKNSFPDLDAMADDPVSIPGTPPDLDRPPSGCAFLDRCPFATEDCEESHPDLVSLPARNQRSACHNVERAARMRRVASDPQTWGIETGESPDAEGASNGADGTPDSGETGRQAEEVTDAGETGTEVTPKGRSRDRSLLETENLTKRYEQRQSLLEKFLGREPTRVRAAHEVTLSVSRSEILGIAGESGSGKSTLAETVALLQEPTRGTIRLAGKPHGYYRDGNMMEFRRKVQIVFQNPYDALNPRMTIRQLVGEPLSIHDCAADDREAVVVGTLERVGLTPGEAFLEKYPHQLSGGQRQRVAIARTLVLEPDLLICDEPASMLDVSLKTNLLTLLRRLADQQGLGVLYISHDLASLAQIADRIAIMYLGRVVEKGETERIVRQPSHPYTEALLSAVPEKDPAANRQRVLLEGESPDPVDIPDGCAFADRCPRATEQCTVVDPDLTARGDAGSLVACHHPGDDTDRDSRGDATDPSEAARSDSARRVADGAGESNEQ